MNLAQFKAKYPNLPLGILSDADVQNVLDEAALVVLPAAWGAKTELGQGLYAAHIISLSQAPQAGAGKAVQTATRKKVGDVEVQYARSQGEQSWYDLTFYGQRFWALKQGLSRGSGVFVV